MATGSPPPTMSWPTSRQIPTRPGSVAATSRSTSAGVSTNVPAWGWNTVGCPSALAASAMSCSRSASAAQAASVKTGDGGASARPADASRSADPSIATHRTSPPASCSSRRCSIADVHRLRGAGRPRPPGWAGRPRPVAVRARPARREADRPAGTRSRTACPRSRSGRSRRGCVRRVAGPGVRSHRIGDRPDRGPRQRVAGAPERLPEVRSRHGDGAQRCCPSAPRTSARCSDRTRHPAPPRGIVGQAVASSDDRPRRCPVAGSA